MRCLLLLVALAVSARAAGFAEQFETIKREASPRQLYALLYQLPKGGDIHHHMGLSFRPDDLWEDAQAFYTRLRINGCASDAMPPIRFVHIDRAAYDKLDPCAQGEYKSLKQLTPAERAQWRSSLVLDRPGEGRNEFFEVIVHRMTALMRDPELLRDQLLRMLRRYQRENIRYVESQATSRLEQMAGVQEALRGAAAADTGVALRLQKVVIRFQPDAEEALRKSYAFVAANRGLWVGINLAGREDNDKGHALRFLDTFREMRRKYSGIPLSLHGGEKDSPGPEVRHTLQLGAVRLGHAVNLIGDPDTMLAMRAGRHLVETSLVSNQLLEYTPDLSRHPFVEYLRFGIPVCLNTDDSGVWDSQLIDEYYLAVRHFDLTWKEVVEIGRNSLTYSFAEPELKERLLASYDQAVAEFERKYDTGGWRAMLDEARPDISGYARRRLAISPAAEGTAANTASTRAATPAGRSSGTAPRAR